jgi:hypothetical protein
MSGIVIVILLHYRDKHKEYQIKLNVFTLITAVIISHCRLVHMSESSERVLADFVILT